MVIYMLIHDRVLKHKWRETKMIGYFSTKGSCNEAIESLLCMPGFCDYPNSFQIIDVRIPDLRKNSVPKTVFEVTSEVIINDTDSLVSYHGVYAYESSAQNRITKCEKKTKSKKMKRKFHIEQYTVNEVLWQEGFDTWNQGDDLQEFK